MATTDVPTPKQLRYLKLLAERAGQSFAYPADRAAASRAIKRLQDSGRAPGYERAEDRQAVAAPPEAALGAARVRDDEVEGYGSSARWAHRR